MHMCFFCLEAMGFLMATFLASMAYGVFARPRCKVTNAMEKKEKKEKTGGSSSVDRGGSSFDFGWRPSKAWALVISYSCRIF